MFVRPQVSYQPCPKPSAALPPYQSCPKPPVGLSSYQPCAPSKPSGLPGCSSLLDDASSPSYSTEVKVTDESGGVIKSLSFQPEPLQTKTERSDGYDYHYAYPNTYRYDDYWCSITSVIMTTTARSSAVTTATIKSPTDCLNVTRTWYTLIIQNVKDTNHQTVVNEKASAGMIDSKEQTSSSALELSSGQ